MTEPAVTDRPPRSAAARIARAVALLAAALVVLSLGALWLESRFARSSLEARVRDLDAAEPGWRAADMAAAMPRPKGPNSADVVADAGRLYVRPGPGKFSAVEALASSAANSPLGPTRPVIDAELAANAAALRAALPLIDLAEEGRFEVDTDSTPLMSPLDGYAAAIRVAELLFAESAVRADRGDLDGALAAARGAMNAGRATGHEPITATKSFRALAASYAQEAMFRALGRKGAATEAELRRCQDLVAREEVFPIYRAVLRAHRAESYANWTDFASGKFPIDRRFYASLGLRWDALGWSRYYFGYRAPELRRQLVLILDFHAAAAKASELPSHERADAEAAVDRDFGPRMRELPLWKLMTAPVAEFGSAARRKVALARAATVLLAAERYRLAEGRWPAAAADMVPKYLAAVPDDPYDGKPLRLARLPDGLVAYAVGDDKADDGGLVGDLPRGPGAPDLGYRLYDPAARADIGSTKGAK